MAIKGMFFSFGKARGGDDGFLGSLFIGFSPRHAVAMTALSETLGDGDGMQQINISRFTTRKPGHATDTVVHPKVGSNEPFFGTPVVEDEHMTSVTAMLWAGPDQAVGGTLSVWFFD